MKYKYRKYNIYLNDTHECRMHIMLQNGISLRKERSMYYRGWHLMKVKRNNINKAMKRLKLQKARNIVVDDLVEHIITKEYESLTSRF